MKMRREGNYTVKWESICTDREAGGLGVKNLHLMNKALLCKWHWRFASSKYDYWKTIISEKYGTTQGEWKIANYKKGSSQNIWPLICKVEESFWGNARYQVNSGDRILFWKHRWLGQETLQDTYPQIFKICTNQDRTVARFACMAGEQVAWDLNWRRNPKKHEIAELSKLLQSFEAVKLEPKADSIYWLPNNKSQFTVKSCYQTLNQQSSRTSGMQTLDLPSKMTFLLEWMFFSVGGGKTSCADQTKTAEIATWSEHILCIMLKRGGKYHTSAADMWIFS